MKLFKVIHKIHQNFIFIIPEMNDNTLAFSCNYIRPESRKTIRTKHPSPQIWNVPSNARNNELNEVDLEVKMISLIVMNTIPSGSARHEQWCWIRLTVSCLFCFRGNLLLEVIFFDMDLLDAIHLWNVILAKEMRSFFLFTEEESKLRRNSGIGVYGGFKDFRQIKFVDFCKRPNWLFPDIVHFTLQIQWFIATFPSIVNRKLKN